MQRTPLAVRGLVAGHRRVALAAASPQLLLSSLPLGNPSRRLSGGGGASSGSGSGMGFMETLRAKFKDMSLEADRRLDEEEARLREEMERVRNGGGGGGRDASGDSGSSNSVKKNLVIAEDPSACPRSVLFMPGSKPRAMAKMYDIKADCFILDLEDSVGPGLKREARINVQQFLLEMEKLPGLGEDAHESPSDGVVGDNGDKEARRPRRRRRVVLRINSPDDDMSNALLDLELAGSLGPVLEGIAIPKVTPRTYELIREYVHPSHTLWAFFESAASVLAAPEICAQGHYCYAVMGNNDLAADLRLPLVGSSKGKGKSNSDENDGGAGADDISEDAALLALAARLPLMHASQQVLLAARAHGLSVLDAVFNDPTDTEGLRRELRLCRALGFDGKTLIHPGQVAPTNAAFTPDAAAVHWAERVREAVAQAGGGVATVDGKMVEELHVRQATRLLNLHRSAGSSDGSSSSGGEDGSGASASGEEGSQRRRKSPPSRQAPHTSKM